MRATILATLLVWFPASAFADDPKAELLEAAKKGDVDRVKALLAKGVDVNAKSEYGVTPLAFAAEKGHVEVVKVLIANKADVNCKDSFYQFTPLDWALLRERADIIKVLLQAGADGAQGALVSAAASGKKEIVRAVLETEKVTAEGLSKALEAAGKHPEVVGLLKKAGARPALKTSAVADPKTLESYAGTYRRSDTGFELKIVIQDGKLALPGGQPARRSTAGRRQRDV